MNTVLTQDIKQFADNFPLKDELRNQTIAITGATGLLGSCMTWCLLMLNRKHQLKLRVIAIVRNAEKARQMFGEETKSFGILTYDFAQHVPFDAPEHIDSLIHFAAPTASKAFVEQPIETMNTVFFGTNSLLDYAQKTHLSSFVLASTLEVYGTIYDDSNALTEEKQGYLDPMATRSSYPLAKRAAEALCHNYASEYGVNAKVARLAQTFGAGVAIEDNRVFAQFAKAVIKQQDITLNTTGELSRSYCYTTDAVSAMLYIMLRGEAGEAYNVANEKSYISICDMAKIVLHRFYPQGKLIFNLQEGLGFSPTTKLRLSTTKIEHLGWQATFSLEEMFNRLIKHLKESM